MPTSIFISHVYEDRGARDAIRRWATKGLLGANVVVTGETEDHRQGGSRAIRGHLNPKLRGASAVVVLVGNDTHNHAWVAYEAQHALSNRKRVVAVRIPNTTGAVPQAVAHLDLVAMNPTAVRAALAT